MADNEIDVSCILYKSIFDPNKLKINEITTYYDNGSKRKEKCVIFTGEGGVEELFYVRDEYDHVCHTLEIVDQELFETWTKVLVHNARNKWISLNPTTRYPQTTAGFNNCFDDFIRNYITDEGAKEVIITYLNSSECVMKHNGTIERHQSRIENMMNYADRLPGIGGILTDDAKKAIISHTFPKEWRSSFRKSMQTIQNTALPDIIQFMKQQQLDEKDGGRRVNEDDNRNQGKRKRNKNRNEREFRGGRARGRSGGRGRGREQHHGGRLKNECKIHGKHEWTNCRENPKGNYYDPNPERGGRGRAEEPVEAFKAEATMEAVEGIINLTTHKIISKQIKIFTTDIIQMEAPCLKVCNPEVLRGHQVCHRNLKHIIIKTCPTGAINLISDSSDSTDGDDTVTATQYHE